jgi:hypothetical protein
MFNNVADDHLQHDWNTLNDKIIITIQHNNQGALYRSASQNINHSLAAKFPATLYHQKNYVKLYMV